MLKTSLLSLGKVQQYIALIMLPSDSHNLVISTKTNFQFVTKTVCSSDIFHVVLNNTCAFVVARPMLLPGAHFKLTKQATLFYCDSNAYLN